MAKIGGTKRSMDKFDQFSVLSTDPEEVVYNGENPKPPIEDSQKETNTDHGGNEKITIVQNQKELTPLEEEKELPKSPSEVIKLDIIPSISIETKEVKTEKLLKVVQEKISAGTRAFKKDSFKDIFIERKKNLSADPKLVRVGVELEDEMEEIAKTLKKVYGTKVTERLILEVALLTLYEKLYGKD